MREDEVYFYTKKWLISDGVKILAGQPPRGTDRFPIIEVKSGTNPNLGSRGAFKPDLIGGTALTIVLFECKPSFSFDDVEKLRSIRDNGLRRAALVDEICQRRVLVTNGLGSSYRDPTSVDRALRFAVAYTGSQTRVPDIYSLVLQEDGSGSLFLDGAIVTDVF